MSDDQAVEAPISGPELDGKRIARRKFIGDSARGAALLGMGAMAGVMMPVGADADESVWQIDPWKCTECGRCATDCVINPSAVKAIHVFGLCGYCDLCTGYFEPNPIALNKGAENHICPTDAIQRMYVEEPYYEYHVVEDRCIGCAKCVDGCESFGNGSLHLQIRQDLCVDCDSCSIDLACPADAFIKVPASSPYCFKGEEHEWKVDA